MPDDVERIYEYYNHRGEYVRSHKPPPTRTRCPAVKSNGTLGLIVCMSQEDWDALLDADEAKRREEEGEYYQRKNELARRRARAECEEKLRAKQNDLRDKAHQRLDRARNRWVKATQDVRDARKVVTDHIAELDKARWWHSKIHNGLSLALDGAGLATAIALPECPFLYTALFALANTANHVVAEWPEFVEGHYLGPGAQVGGHAAGEAGAILLHHGGYHVVSHGVHGVLVGKDIYKLFSDVETYSFSSPESLGAVKAIKGFFDHHHLNWAERAMGPSKEELDKSFDDLIKKMEEEQAAQREYAEAYKMRVLDQNTNEMTICIDTRARLYRPKDWYPPRN